MFRVENEVEEDLDELVSGSQDAEEVGSCHEHHGDLPAPERVFVELQRALHQIVDLQQFLLGGWWPREVQKVLHNLRSAPRLAVGQVELFLHGFIAGAGAPSPADTPNPQ